MFFPFGNDTFLGVLIFEGIEFGGPKGCFFVEFVVWYMWLARAAPMNSFDVMVSICVCCICCFLDTCTSIWRAQELFGKGICEYCWTEFRLLSWSGSVI